MSSDETPRRRLPIGEPGSGLPGMQDVEEQDETELGGSLHPPETQIMRERRENGTDSQSVTRSQSTRSKRLKISVPTISFAWFKRFGRSIQTRTTFGKLRHAPISGIRNWIYVKSEERWNFGLTRKQRRQFSIETINSWNPDSAVLVVTFGGGGGIGKTTTALTLAQQAQDTRKGKPVLLIEKNPQGTVASATRVSFETIEVVKQGQPGEACFTVSQAYRNRDKLTSFGQIQSRFAVMPNTGLFILTYPDEQRLAGEAIKDLISRLKQYFSVIILDSDQDFGNADTHAVLEITDVIALITEHNNETRIEQAAKILKRIRSDSRYRHQTASIVLVINKVWFNFLHRGTSKSVNILHRCQQELGEELYDGPVTTLPWNPTIKTKRYFKVSKLSRRFRLCALELTAAVFETAKRTMSNNEPEQQPTEVDSTPRVFAR